MYKKVTLTAATTCVVGLSVGLQTVVTSDNFAVSLPKPQTVHTAEKVNIQPRAGGQAAVNTKLVKKKTVVTLRNVKGKTKIVWWLKSSKKTQSGTLKINGTKKYIIKKKISKLQITTTGYTTLTLKAKNQTRTLTPKTSQGSASDYAFSIRIEGRPARWDPCTYNYVDYYGMKQVTSTISKNTLTWAYEKGAWVDPLFTKSLADVSAASGWTFKQVSLNTQPDITVQVDANSSANSANGVGYTSRSGETYTSGIVEAHLGKSVPNNVRIGLLTHELGHVLGLDHVNSKSQLMYPTVSWSSSGKLAAGDRNGLSKLGTAPGCVLNIGDLYW